jgi:hypothetical protein
MEKGHVIRVGGSLLVLFGATVDVSQRLNQPQCNPSAYWCAPIQPQPGHTLPASSVAATITSTYSGGTSHIAVANTTGGAPVNIPLWAQGSRWPDYPAAQQIAADMAKQG